MADKKVPWAVWVVAPLWLPVAIIGMLLIISGILLINVSRKFATGEWQFRMACTEGYSPWLWCKN